MDIKKLRQEFEKLPDIKGILYGSDFGFNESLNEYYHPDHTNHRLNYAFIMGAWMAWKAQTVPEGFVFVPKLSANYLFNKVPELGFKHKDEKDTVLYHLNYMASEFRDSAKQFTKDDHEKQKAMIEEGVKA